MGRVFSYVVVLRFAAAVLLGSGMGQAWAEGDPPGRVARLNYAEGTVAYAPSGEREWTDADLNRPLVAGDKLWTDKGVRAEIQAGSSSVRMDGRTRLTVLALDDRSAQLSVTQGTVYLRVRNLPEGENFEIDTPNLAYRAAYPGDYRVDVDAQRGVTRVTIHSGTGAVYGEQGQVLAMGGGQQITFKGRQLQKVNVQEQPPQDNFDRWAGERNRRDDQSVAARYVPREVVGYQLLDASGEWRQDASYGPVWFPQGMPANWAPYRQGRWDWIAPWGWTWIDDAPWAFVTSHYGRWALIGTRWAWAPGRPGLRPVYAPALVAFVGDDRNAPLSIGGKPSVAWFPLAPGEAWQPAYRATPLYISSVNANMPPLKEGPYAYQRKPEALTAIALDDFQRGKPSRSGGLRVAANTLANAQVTAPPPMPERARTMLARSSAPASEVQQVTNSGPTVQQQVEAQREQQGKAQEARRSEPQKIEGQKQEQKRVAQQKVQQQRSAEAKRAAEQARRETAAARKVEQARREAQAKRERELQARRAQDASRLAAAAAAKKGEQARQAAHAQQVEQARRAAERDAQSLAQQRAQREAWQKQQQAVAEQFRRDQQAWEEQQRARQQQQRPRPDVRRTPPPAEPDVWQRGIPILNSGRIS
jgi:hypothetical protein